jgi:hypothetical protein
MNGIQTGMPLFYFSSGREFVFIVAANVGVEYQR